MNQISSDEKKLINAQFVFGDLLDQIFQHLSVYDLLNCALVCKSWNIAVSRELARRGPEISVLPHIFNYDYINIENNKSKFHVYNKLRTKPHVAILFVGPSTRERSETINQLEFNVLIRYSQYFHGYLIVVGVDECMVDKNVFTSCDGLLGRATGIPGIFLPQYKDLNIKVVRYYYRPMLTENDIGFINDLKLENEDSIIMFCQYWGGGHLCKRMLERFKSEYKQKKYSLWGGCFDDKLQENNYGKTAKNKLDHAPPIIAIKISGASLKTWSTVIDCTLQKEKIDEKLKSFKEKLKLRRQTIGLVCGPRYVEPIRGNMYVNSHELTDAVKSFFPRIQFTAIFNFGYHDHYGVDSTIDDENQKLYHQMTMCLMILTYN